MIEKFEFNNIDLDCLITTLQNYVDDPILLEKGPILDR